MASVLSESHFHNEEAAVARLEAIVWPQGAHCPRCGGFHRITTVRGARLGLRRCGPCKREFTVTVGTIFERSHVKLHLWFQTAHLMASSKKGISAHQLHRTLGVTYKTAWFMGHRLREAMRDGRFSIGGEGKTVEFDETFVGGKEANKHRSKRQSGNIGGKGKEAVFSLVERGGKVQSHHVANVNGNTLRPIMDKQIAEATRTISDDGGARARHGALDHHSVNHSIGEYVRGDIHTNTIEGYFSILKRGIIGTYHHRYNERTALGINDTMRADKAVSGIVGKRLLYRDSLAW